MIVPEQIHHWKLFRTIAGLIAILFVFSCSETSPVKNEVIQPDSTITEENYVPDVQYSEEELVSFLDSVGKLPQGELIESTAFHTDSIFRNRERMNKVISASDFEKLKTAFEEESISRQLAKSIFGEFALDSSYLKQDNIPVTLHSFDNNKNDYKEFAVSLGLSCSGIMSWDGELYFFKSNRIISKHHIQHRYGLELEHYKDSDGKTVIYYKENYASGSGIWWFNYYFYKYYGDELIPVLNELQNGNEANPRPRCIWLESSVIKTNPLTLKMVYYQELNDTVENLRIIDDSTNVQYKWNEKTKMLEGNYGQSKISKAQILSYYIDAEDLLFMNSYYQILKNVMADSTKKPAALRYLNAMKNQYSKHEN